nr:MAG TPA: hypothetical protein [Caudoviricetes sp.]
MVRFFRRAERRQSDYSPVQTLSICLSYKHTNSFFNAEIQKIRRK